MAAVPVVAVTSFAMVGDRDLALAAGFDDYMTKPIEPETFTRDIVAYLPEELRGSQPTPAESAPATERIVPAAGAQPGAGILVLDDSPTNQALLRSMLEPYGHHVRTTSTVGEAIAAAEAKIPDLVLSDVHVGAQRGIDFLDHLRSVPALARVPFAFLTATADPRSPLVGDGTARVITRPIDTAALLAEIGTLLGSPVEV
jgi:two-component system cell cycle response regulator